MSGRAMAILSELDRRGIKVAGLCLDSRQVRPGDVFLAWRGAHSDGRGFIADALANGASAALYEPSADMPAVPPGLSALPVPDLSALCGEIAHLVYGRPSEQMAVIGITGTNGKTSISQWIAQALSHLGRKCAVVGTLGNGFPGALTDSLNTTPDAITVHSSLAAYLRLGARACAMEVSSIGLDQGRVNGVRFATAVFTNLTRDHLEYHGNMEAYGAAKRRLFDMPGLDAAVLNLDDAFGARLAAELNGRLRTIGYTLEGCAGADLVLTADDIAAVGAGVDFRVGGVAVHAPVVGRFNVSNLLAVAGTLVSLGVPLEQALAVLGQVQSPPGRMQTLGGTGLPLVVVDYAHTPDALEKLLGSLRETAQARGGRLVCLFGCGGDRDPGKRPLMGEVVERLADEVIVTSDNPRGEDPLAIIAAVRGGMKRAATIEADRARAIDAAIAGARAADVVVLAGKGHETYQEIAGQRHPFSDLAQARAALERRA